ncbi:MAG: UDP-N-acetylmuramoyl-L-alanine--D-glutamate ligase [Jatrophihabitans sp.]|uniref:UDP-N-acetylmuramoyl-L-alanine--D-glutamate ligase n=1 Tax=Jatrophihabitans sp. TaxID=1932789 RepID=UPI00390DFA15
MADRLPDLSGSAVLVCGARFAGQAAARALLARGAAVRLTDRDRPAGLDELIAAGAEFAGPLDSVPADTALVVTSPGWPPRHPLFADATARGIEVIGELEFAWRLRGPAAADWLVVTGTNGKTTTVRMLESMLRADGLRALAVGNVGVSIIDAVVAAVPYDVLAVEASSYQLYWSSTIRPRAGVLLNLAPDHLDWHGSMEAYEQAKTAVWDGDVAVANADDPRVTALFAPGGVSFTLGEPRDGQLGVANGRLVSRAFGDDRVPLAEVDAVRPSGAHNVANALAAAALARARGVAPRVVDEGLRTFVPDPHRNQVVHVADGVTWVDDSKATNPHAAQASLRGYPRIVWVAGGQLKGVDVSDLVATVADRLAGVVLLGADRALVAAALARHAPDVPVITVDSTDDGAMTEVVHAAAGLARPGDTVLLAPAAASYDMFSGYAARGDAFADAAREQTT